MFSRRRFLKAGAAGMITATALPAPLSSAVYAEGVDRSVSGVGSPETQAPALAARARPPANVLLDNIAGLGAPKTFGPLWQQTTFSSCAASVDGRLVYFGRTASYDPAMRNLVVASLDAFGNVLGIPQGYPSSAWPLAPIGGYPPVAVNNATITAILVNAAKSRLYMAESRTAATQPTTPGLNVYTLDAGGNPTGAVRTYANGNVAGGGAIAALAMHPKLPLLYMVGWGMTGVAAQPLDGDGEPTGAPKIHNMGSYGKYSLGISADARHLYLGSYPDVLEVVGLDSDGNPTGAFSALTVSNADVGAVSDYLRFTMGANAIYMVRPDPGGGALPILALWPLDSVTGLPIGGALARADIHPLLVAASAMTIAADEANGRLWVPSATSFADAFTGATIVSGVTPTSYAINADGTLAESISYLSLSDLSTVAVLAPASASGSPLFVNASAASIGNRVKGYQCRIAVLAASGASFPLIMNTNQGISFGSLTALNAPSKWVGL